MLRRLSEVWVISWALLIGSIALLSTWVWYWVSSAKGKSESGPVPDYSFDFMEHQNYWEADNR
jgi:hypothetical protein